MDWDDVRIFLAVARAGRVSSAAKQLAVEHTTVSRRLAALEAELGAKLFYRTASGYRLTPLGESVLASSESMERAALTIRARSQEESGELSGRVRLALLDELATHWLTPKLPAFRARYPAIELQIVAGIAPLNLSRGEADLAIRTPRPRQVGLTAVRIARTKTGLYASKALLGGKRLSIDSADSARGYELLLYTPEYHRLQSAAWFQPVLAATKVALSSNSTLTLLAAARASLGIAVLPRLVAHGSPDLVPVSDDLSSGEMWLVSHPELRRDAKVRVLAEFLKRAATGAEGIR